jgi:hypothetical protein
LYFAASNNFYNINQLFMRLKHSLFSLLAVAFSSISVYAQHYEHATLWGRLTLTTPLSKKVDIQFEYLHRSQNNFHESRWNPLNNEISEQPRLWLFFKQKNYTFQLSPLSFLYSEPLLGKEADFKAPKNIEWRSVVGVETQQTEKKWTFKERVQYEARWLKTANFVVTGRIRMRGTLQYQVTPKTKLQMYDDVFFNMPPHKLTQNFDQNWFLVGIMRKINDHVNFDLGIMRNYKKRPNGTEFDHETGINTGFSFRIF